MKLYRLACLGTLATAAILAACSDDDVNGVFADAGSKADAGKDGSRDGSPNQTGDDDSGAVDPGSDAASDGSTATNSTEVQFISLSDWHGQLDPLAENDVNGESQSYGGVGVYSTILKQARAANPNTIFLTSGDEFGATPTLSTIFNDKPAVESLNFLKLDVDTLGNHNFDNGIPALKANMLLAKHPFVSSNLSRATEEFGADATKPFHILEVGPAGAKVKVGVVGITNPDATSLTLPGALGSLTIKEPIAAANQAAKDARAAGANVVVVLVHMGAVGKDAAGNAVGPLIEFSKGLSGIDIVFGDHTNFTVNTTIGDALVLEAKSSGRQYGRTKITVANGKVTGKTAEIVDPLGIETAFLGKTDAGAVLTCPQVACPTGFACSVAIPDGGVDASVAPGGKCRRTLIESDPAAETVLKPYRDKLFEEYDKKVAVLTGAKLDQDGTKERLGETPLGNLVTDAMLDKYRAIGAQIAFTQGGGLRAPLPSSYTPADATLRRSGAPYDLVMGDVYTLLPFGNTCVVRKITGATLYKVLENGVSKVSSVAGQGKDGRYVQISGIHFTFDVSKPAGTRVTAVTLDNGGSADGGADGGDGGGGTVITREDQNEYTIVTNNFINAGGDGYTMLPEATPSAPREVLADVVRDYLKAHSPIAPPALGRQTKVGGI